MALDRETRRQWAQAIVDRMQAHYEEHGEGDSGDFSAGRDWLANHASQEELTYQYEKWCNK